MRKKYIDWGFIALLSLALSFQPVFARSGKPILKKGMSGIQVTQLQKNLKKLGYFTSNPTGVFGDITESSVKKFQQKYRIPITGVVAALTYNKLDILLKRADPIKIVVDPGHGGIDIGTSKDSVIESKVDLSISKKLKSFLDSDIYSAVLTRSTDIALDSRSNNGDTRQERDLNARTNIINKSGAKLFVSIHVNSYPESPSTNGSIVYYNDKYPQSRVLAQDIQKALNNLKIRNLKRQTNNSQTADYYVLKNSNIPGVIVETAFITNVKERQLLATDSFREKIAKAISTGIKEYSSMKKNKNKSP